MAGSTVKIRLKAGGREIEVEGQRTDVDDLLGKWWHSDGDAGDEVERETPVAKKSGAKRKPRATENKETGDEGAADDDPHEIAGRIKEDKRFEIFAEKVLHARNLYNKVALISWFEDRPLSTGAIHKTLATLRVKLDQGNVSRTLQSNKFMADKKRERGGRAKYSLTAPARSAFEKWLLADGR
jgi:hypothetical protein